MSFDTLQKSRIIRRILGWVGLWTEEEEANRLPLIVKSMLLHIPLTFTYTVLMWLDVIYSTDLTQAKDVLYIAFTETALVVKIVSIIFHRRLAMSIFDQWQDHVQFKLNTVREHIVWQKSFKIFGLVSFLYILCSISVVCFAFTAVLFLETYQLPFPYWTPFDWQQPRYYWFAYFYGALAMPFTCVSNCTLDMWQCYMIQHLAMCLKIISMRLENLGEKMTDADVTKALIRIIKFHQEIVRMSKLCERIVSYPIMAQILLSALVLCFSLYRLQNVNFFEDPGTFLVFLQYAVCMTLQIFLPCYYGNQLTLESSRPVVSIYNCNWMEMSPANRRMVYYFMRYLNKPVVLRAGSFFEIGLSTYTKTMNNAYSFFALLLNMDTE